MEDLIEHLPPESALVRAMNPHWYWTTDHELLAVVAERVDLVASMVYQSSEQFYRANVKHPQRWKKWEHLRIPRPGEDRKKRKKKRPATEAELRSIFPGRR